MPTSEPIQLSCSGVYPALSVVSMSMYRDWQHQRTIAYRERKQPASRSVVPTPANSLYSHNALVKEFEMQVGKFGASGKNEKWRAN